MSISDILPWLSSKGSVKGSVKGFADGHLQNFDCSGSGCPDNSQYDLSLSSYVLADIPAFDGGIALTADNTVEVFFRGQTYSLSC